VNRPATLISTARGESRSLFAVRLGDYVWHAGAFRLVTGRNGRSVKMGRYVLHSLHADTVEAAPRTVVFRELVAWRRAQVGVAS
jgi:hypothetical protein